MQNKFRFSKTKSCCNKTKKEKNKIKKEFNKAKKQSAKIKKTKNAPRFFKEHSLFLLFQLRIYICISCIAFNEFPSWWNVIAHQH